jgi:hypothetical protein
VRTIVRIANPVPGGKRYTSLDRAKHYVKMRRAVMTDEGELFFYTSAQLLIRREEENLREAIKRYRGGVILWNGSSKPNHHGPVLHGPGEVRS